LGRGAAHREGMWRRHGEVLERRIELWRQAPMSVGAVACLIRSTSRGDYGRRWRGGSGLRSLARDVLRVAEIRHRQPT
jgi:hypothetical protein